MPWLFQYFWFVGAAFMLVNIAIWRRRLAVVVERGAATKAEVDRFVSWLAVYLVGAPIVMGVIGLVAGWSSPFCAGVLLFADVPRSIVSLVTVAGWFALLWWVWRGAGADFLSRVGPALAQRPSYDTVYSPRVVRLVVTAIVVLSSIGSVVTSRTMPLTPDMGCSAAPKRTA